MILATTRRETLAGLAGLTVAGWTTRVWAMPAFRADPFSLGVASGDPAPDGFVIWTRLAPEPFDGGGMPDAVVVVAWEVAEEPDFRRIVAKGEAPARPELAHSVHIEVGGLQPARDYSYRFTVAGIQSQTGRARTLPALGAPVASFKLGLAGCQRYDDGYYTAYRHMADERFDLIFHYGDYIYEHAQYKPGGAHKLPVIRPMPRPYGEARTLADYRNRYAVYKADADLQAAHASAPFVISFDDHEVDNNWAGEHCVERGVTREQFLARRAAAFQAWYEHMPVRAAQRPVGPDVQAYRRIAIGDLATLNVLDTRQFRSPQACGDGWKVCPEAADPSRTMMGAAQEKWLADSFRAERRRWTILAQQVLLMRLDRDPDPATLKVDMDKWDGASAARDRLFADLAAAKVANVVVLTGDIHNNWAGELKADFGDERSRSLGVEFVGTSISSDGDGSDTKPAMPKLFAINPHIKFFNNQRGYMRHTLTPKTWTADFRTVERISVPGMPVTTRQRFVVEAGAAKLNPA
jgi:alkaline phosphatase D